jgi:hypothetical protein
MRQRGHGAALQRLALPGDSAEAVQPNELQGSVRACHRNGRSSVSRSKVKHQQFLALEGDRAHRALELLNDAFAPKE